jgi:hypothetical protein
MLIEMRNISNAKVMADKVIADKVIVILKLQQIKL